MCRVRRASPLIRSYLSPCNTHGAAEALCEDGQLCPSGASILILALFALIALFALLPFLALLPFFALLILASLPRIILQREVNLVRDARGHLEDA